YRAPVDHRIADLFSQDRLKDHGANRRLLENWLQLFRDRIQYYCRDGNLRIVPVLRRTVGRLPRPIPGPGAYGCEQHLAPSYTTCEPDWAAGDRVPHMFVGGK